MPNTKATLIYDALIRVTGGVVTPNMSTRYGEAETYLSYAFNYVQLGTYWVEGKAEAEHTINPACWTPFDNIPLQFSSVRRRWFITLPSPVVPLPKGRALYISDQFGNPMIPLTQGDEAMQEYYGQYSSQLKYQLEGNTTVWFWGVEGRPLLKFVRPKYIVQITDLPDDAEILLAADGYKTILDLMFGWLSGEKQLPKQYEETGKDRMSA